MHSIPLVTGAAVFFVIGAWTTVTRIPEIEEDLETRVSQALVSEGIPFHRVEARGRGVEVTGVPESDSANLMSGAKQVRGVGGLEVRGDLGGEGAWLRIRADEGRITIEGTVESEELATRIRADSRSGFAGRSIRFDLGVDESRVEPLSWPTRFLPLMTVAGREIAQLTLTMDGEALVVGGHTITTAAADSLAAQIFGAAPGLALRSLLNEAADFDTRLEAALSGSPIAFRPGTSRLAPGSRDVLERIARAMDAGDGGILIVSRWTEGDASGRRVAAARAGVVRDYLVVHGVDPDRIESRTARYEGSGPTVSISPGR